MAGHQGSSQKHLAIVTHHSVDCGIKSHNLRYLLPKRSELGQDLAEYGLLVALIALIVIGAVTLIGTNISTMYNLIQAGFAGIP